MEAESDGMGTDTEVACECGTIGNPAVLRFCQPCHKYWYGDKRLIGVTSVIKEVLPPSYDNVPPDVLETARVRGVQLDELVSAYVVGNAPEFYPLGTQYAVIDLFNVFREWWERKGFKANSQVVVYDDELAGTVDLMIDGTIWDLKCTYDVMPTHLLQVEGYADISGKPAGGIIHVTKRYKEPRLVEATKQTQDDWRTVRAFWRLRRKLYG